MVLLQRTDIDILNLGNAKQEIELRIRDLKNRKEICLFFFLFYFPGKPQAFCVRVNWFIEVEQKKLVRLFWSCF